MPGLDRRRFLIGSAAVLLAACGDGGGDQPDSTASGASGSSGGGPASTGAADTTTGGATPASVVLGTAFNRNTYLQAGTPQRATFVLFAASGGFVGSDDAPAELTFEGLFREDGSRVSATVARHGDELDRPYYPASLTFPMPGLWEVSTELPDGTTLAREVQVNDAVPFPQVGDRLPAVATPTVDEPLDAGTLCTRTPACPLHQESLADVLAQGRPTAVLVSTPAYCQVAICGPVLDLLLAADPGELAVIHLEAFPNGSGSDPGPPSTFLTQDLRLDFEPVLFVAGADGVITARLDSIYDGVELASALDSAR